MEWFFMFQFFLYPGGTAFTKAQDVLMPTEQIELIEQESLCLTALKHARAQVILALLEREFYTGKVFEGGCYPGSVASNAVSVSWADALDNRYGGAFK